MSYFSIFFLICHIYPPFTRKRIVSLYFGLDVRTCLGVAISDVSGQGHLEQDNAWFNCKRCYFAFEPCIVYTTRQLLPVAKKDVLPAFHQSNIVYQFLCHCDSRYVGRTFQRLQQRIKQHVPKTILQEHISRDRSTLTPLASQSEALKLKLPFLLLDNIFYKTLHAHVNIMITNFLFLPVAVLLLIFPPLKPCTSKHPNQIYANKRNSFMV